MTTLETDYLVVGAGASGMAFADALVADSDADVVVVDRRHRPGGHWNDAYPFVRLHQPSAFYGVSSERLGEDRIDDAGPNAGYYERASASEICAYYERVLDHLQATGRIRFLGMCDHAGGPGSGHRVVSILTGQETEVRVRRKLVDATFLESAVPATHTPSFRVGEEAHVVPPNDLVRLAGDARRYTVLGSGKTAMDTCCWLMDNGVEPERIRWVRPRDAWLLDRGFVQPLDQVGSVIEGVSLELQAAAEAEGPEDLFRRLEDCGHLHRLDPDVEPTMYRMAILSQGERESLRRIEDVVRLGRVRAVEPTELVLEGGSVPSVPGDLHVDCTAAGLRSFTTRPIFQADRITIQPMRVGLTPFNAAMVGYIEASRNDDAEKNRLCPPNIYTSTTADWIPATYTATRAEVMWGGESDIQAWLESSRLNIARGVADHIGEPKVQAAVSRLFQYREPALENLERLMAEDGAAST